IVRLVSSILVLITMTLAALASDEVVTAWADAAGSLLVAAFIVVIALQTLKTSVPDLLDRSAGRPVRGAVDRALSAHAGQFARLERLRSRRSGPVIFGERVPAFEP